MITDMIKTFLSILRCIKIFRFLQEIAYKSEKFLDFNRKLPINLKNSGFLQENANKPEKFLDFNRKMPINLKNMWIFIGKYI